LKGARGRKTDDGEPNAAGGKDLGDVKVKHDKAHQDERRLKKKRGKGRLKEREGDKRLGEGDEVHSRQKRRARPACDHPKNGMSAKADFQFTG
jgi:hypothetical protein